MIPQTKGFFQSKTNILNIAAGVVTLLTPILASDFVKANAPQIIAIGGTIVALCNIILRTFSTAIPIVPPQDPQ